MKRFVLVGAFVAACATLAACGGGSAAPATSLSLAAATPTSAAAVRGESSPTSTAAPLPSATATAAATEPALPTATPAATSAAAPTATPSGAVVQPPTPVPPTPTTVPPPLPAPTPPPTPAGQEVTIGVRDNNLFSPRSKDVNVGDTVTWIWQGSGGFHDLSSSDFLADPAGSKGQGSYSYTFKKAGTYNYVCLVHVSVGMRGIIIVK